MNAPSRKISHYLFHGQTTSLCETCLALVPAKIVIEDVNRFLSQTLPHAWHPEDADFNDAAFYRLCRDYIKPGDRPCNFRPEPISAALMIAVCARIMSSIPVLPSSM